MRLMHMYKCVSLIVQRRQQHGSSTYLRHTDFALAPACILDTMWSSATSALVARACAERYALFVSAEIVIQVLQMLLCQPTGTASSHELRFKPSKRESQIPEPWLVSTSKCPRKVRGCRVRIRFSRLKLWKLVLEIDQHRNGSYSQPIH